MPHSPKIEDRCRKLAKAGMPRSKIFESIQNYQDAPRSLTTFYKHYRAAIDEEAGDISLDIGDKMVQKAKEGDFHSMKFFLETRGGWKDDQVNVEVKTKTEDKGAMDKLLIALGKEPLPDDPEESDSD